MSNTWFLVSWSLMIFFLGMAAIGIITFSTPVPIFASIILIAAVVTGIVGIIKGRSDG